jgi:hypothetical protein
MQQSLLEFLATKTSIQALQLNFKDLPSERCKQIINVLLKSENSSLKILQFANITDLQSDFVDLSVELITKLKLETFSCCDVYWTEEGFNTEIDENDSRLKSFEAQGYHVSISKRGISVNLEAKPTQFHSVVYHPYIVHDEQTNLISALPKDIMQYILNNLHITSVVWFKCVNKKFRSWMLTSSFWRNYYLSRASVISSDILTAADLIYGYQLAQNRSANFWECINIAFAENLCGGSRVYSLNAFHAELVSKLLHTYPELRLMIFGFRLWHVQRGWSPSRLTFYVMMRNTVLYHIHIDMMRPDTVGVLFFLARDMYCADSMDPAPRATYDWFVSSCIDEVLTKIKPMIEAITVVMRSANSWTNKGIPLRLHIDCDALPLVHRKCLDSIASTFDDYAKTLLIELQVQIQDHNAMCSLIDQFSKHVSSVRVNYVTTDYDVIHRRADYWPLYRLKKENGTIGNWNFELSGFPPAQHSKKPISKVKQNHTKKRGQIKKLPHVAFICLFRKVLNLVMMPVLKSLWLRNMNDAHTEWYSFDKLAPYQHLTSPLVPWYDYYYRNWQSLESVSVSHAKPSSWPMSAIVMGNIIAPYICKAVVSLVQEKWLGSHVKSSAAEIETLIEKISQHSDLFPSSNAYIKIIKAALQF